MIFLLIITFDQTGLINFVYIIFCLYHIYNFRKFLKPDQYTLPNDLKYIKFFVYMDLFINIAYQIPLHRLHSGDSGNSWQKVIGIFRFSEINPDTYELEFENISVIVNKSIMFCLFLLMDHLVKSPVYDQFVNEKLLHFKEISLTKARCLTFLYNNNKLRKIIKIQYEKDTMDLKIKMMKKQVETWNKKYLNPKSLSEVRNNTILSQTQKQNMAQSMRPRDPKTLQQMDFFKMGPIEETKDDPNKSFKSQNVMPSITDSLNSSFVKVEEDHELEIITLEEEETLLNELKKQSLRWFIRLFNWIKKKYSNQMLLISSGQRLKAIEKDLIQGKHKVNTTLENKLLINFYLEQNKGINRINELNDSMPERYRVDHVRSEIDYRKGLNLIPLSAILGVIVSNSSIW